MTKPKHYPDVNPNPDFPALENKILSFWEKDKTFEKSVENRDGSNEFIFYDGPPFANGLPHYGHLLTGYVKDIFARYQTIKGSKVERRFGWDCHGLPAEMGAEKELGISGRIQIMEHGIDKFNDTCRTSVMKYTSEWENYVSRQARWVDFKNDYKTMDTSYMESVIWAFKQLYEKGLVYEQMRVMPYSWACETPLSNFETRLDNSYREKTSKAVTVAFTLNEKPSGAPDADEYRVLAWTTTPWTLPSNLALGVGEKVEYACVVVEESALGAANSTPSPLRGEGGVGVIKKDLTNLAKNLRQNQTEAENKLWQKIRDKQIAGYKFRRQQQIGNYIVDFVNLEQKLVIELDGSQHAENAQQDAERTRFLNNEGFRVMRVWNNQIFENLSGVCETILNYLENPDTQIVNFDHPHPTLPPQGGGKRGFAPQGEGAPASRKVCYIMAKSALAKYDRLILRKDSDKITIYTNNLFGVIGTGEPENKIEPLKNFDNSSLIGLTYTPLFPYFSSTPNAFRILAADFVTDEDGTGIVHLAPGFGEDDQAACAAAGIEVICPVDNAGRFTDEIFDIEEQGHKLTLRGLNVIAAREKSEGEPFKDEQIEKYGLANLRIVYFLKQLGRVVKEEDYKHNYPHCWRTDTPLIYKAVPSWYVEVTKFKDRMVELNQQINWIPDHIKDGQFGKWLENARDWSISRNRFWGAPIPIWRSDNPKNKKLYVFGSIKELEEFFGRQVKDLHRPFIDELTKPDPEDAKYTLRRVEDVFDCWFESGSMPYAQVHYPFSTGAWDDKLFSDKNWAKKNPPKNYPADFIVEYVAQTRGWFYTLMVLSTALFDCPPFKNCICHGVVLDEKGQKLSKRLNNYADPMEIFKKFGSDAMRWVMISAPIMHGGELLIDKEGNMIRDAVRLVLKPVWNAYNFFTLYANADGIKARFKTSSDNLMDRYILAKCRDAVENVQKFMDAYDTPGACKVIENFFEVLNNWYIRRSKERFWKSEHDNDKFDAYNSLYSILHIISRAMSPLLPLISEEIWQALRDNDDKNSVHLADFPDVSKIETEAHLMHDMDRVRDLCNATLSIRSTENLRIRQPLQRLTVVDKNPERLADYTDIIKDEVNVKEVDFSGDVARLADYQLKVNFPVLGKRLPAKMKDVIAATKKGEWEKTADGRIKTAGEILEKDEFTLTLQAKNPKGTQSLSSNDALVILDLNVTDHLRIEGFARDLVRFIQQSRKDAGLNITDKIKLKIESANDDIRAAVYNFGDYISEQTLATKIESASTSGTTHNFTQDFDGEKVAIGFDV